MKPANLTKIWNALDHSKLFPEQFSIRLPILTVAKISALCEMYPEQSKTAIINNLIITALDQVVELLSIENGKLNDPTQDGSFDDPELSDYVGRGTNKSPLVRSVYEDNSLRDQFLRLTKTHLKQLEKEAQITEQRWAQLFGGR